MHACSCQRGGAAAAPRVAGGRLPSAAGSSSKKAPSCVRPCACCRAPRDTQHTRHLVLGELRWLSFRWAEALLKIARMTLTIKRDGNWSSFQLANSALPLSVTSSAIAPSARIPFPTQSIGGPQVHRMTGCSTCTPPQNHLSGEASAMSWHDHSSLLCICSPLAQRSTHARTRPQKPN